MQGSWAVDRTLRISRDRPPCQRPPCSFTPASQAPLIELPSTDGDVTPASLPLNASVNVRNASHRPRVLACDTTDAVLRPMELRQCFATHIHSTDIAGVSRSASEHCLQSVKGYAHSRPRPLRNEGSRQ